MATLRREPLAYRVVHTSGSHRKLKSTNGYPDIDFVYHDRDEVPPGLVRRMLVRRVGLSEAEALELL